MPDHPPIGVTLPTSGGAADPGALGALAQTAEDLGYDSVWISDHVVVPATIASTYPYAADGRFGTSATQAYLEPLTSLGYLAGVTRRVRLGVAVLVLPYRHPLLTAKMVTTLDNLSGGRIDLGVGVGWMREEFEALGQPTYAERGAATDEQLQIFKTVWTQDIAGFDGRFYPFAPVGALPHPLQKPYPPIWVGGHSRPALRRTARYADGWLPIVGRPGADLPPDAFAGLVQQLRQEIERAGRDPASVKVRLETTILFEDGAGRPLNGSPEQVAAEAARYRRAGAEAFLVNLGARPAADYERRLRRLAEEVMPALSATPA
jgi:probable F420-dependent oxidoreductase